MFVYISQVCRLRELFTDSIFTKVIKKSTDTEIFESKQRLKI